MKDELHELIQSKGFALTDEACVAIENLIDCLGYQGSDDITPVLDWLEERRKNYAVNTEEIGVNELQGWSVDPSTGNVHHDSGKFFSIIGVRISGAQNREVTSWTQPMIKQAECGILGILCKNIDGVRHYLLSAKYEPGNKNKLQLSPTLQATESNLKQAHGGKKPRFAEYFEDGGKGKVLVNVEGVEDGGRFYLKTNRNMIVELPEDELQTIPADCRWVTFSQIKKLLKKDLVVNSLARSVFGSY